ncbi:Glutamine--tRNA ligase [Gracilariopsis chorda]|uniref:glutamine--tRNA ligase n=1 Tax=Gracilariopsis chorda TaxID=448386 RepID=A0A2V3IFV9_9FLOR|nr:Glutamine--tRNA ligase [Gracilariopsis chorda]|eukprot:PXF40918.1 Glutamine--tRNA ligase [Gracilariopsis chorda]
MPSNPSKEAPADAQARANSLLRYGLESRLAHTVAKSEKTTNALLHAFSAAQLTPASENAPLKAALLYTATTKLNALVGNNGRSLLYGAIAHHNISDAPHVEAAAAWLNSVYKTAGGSVPDAKLKLDDVAIDHADFDRAAGVGVTVSPHHIEAAVQEAIQCNKPQLLEKRYRFNLGLMQRSVMQKLRFADGKAVNTLIRSRVEQLLGPKTQADLAKPPKLKKPKSKKAPTAPRQQEGTKQIVDPFEGVPNRFEARGLSSAENTPELLEKHRLATGGKVLTRFPPEPNGYLHVGHAKAMFIDFGYANKMGGECILRFDDTNPTVEKKEYIHAVIEMVKWMGHEPSRITYSSEYFEQLYELALQLIKRGKAYVCHQTPDDISKGRKEGTDSPWRHRSVEQNIRLFDDMRKGKYGEGEATLRMKIDMNHPNLVMRDPVAYRVIHAPHPHIGDKWCVYPSYDYTHCIVDSLEWITHSLCTLEFEIRRDSYYWLLEALDLYRPFVWESSRLNLQFTVMSKRKLKQLVEEGYVRGWDDPRMPTLVGMRRRGYSPNSLNRFCNAIGVSRANNVIGMHVLEHWVRAEHDTNAKRVFAVLRPLKVTIRNFREKEVLSVGNHPKNEGMGKRDVILTKTVYIEDTDFREVDEKGYYGLAPGKSAMLRYAYPVKIVDVVKTDDKVTELIAEMDYEKSVKPKGVLHWVGEDACPFEARLYSTLFKSPDPSVLKDEWLSDLNKNSEVVLKDSLIETSVKGAETGETFQFERTGYFTVDSDSNADKMVFNMTVSLRDSR